MLFSIITVSLNAKDLIADTINSVLSQDFDDYEIIVKDGCSTDDTVKMVPDDERIRIIVEKDTSIYNAMNQAIREAKGEYLLFLNCGDKLYSSDVLSAVASEIKKQPENVIMFGDSFAQNKGITTNYPQVITKRFLQTRTICHQASFIPKKSFELGLYDEKYKVVADWKHFLESYLAGYQFANVNKVICSYLGGGYSESEKGLALMKSERKEIVKQKYTKKERFLMWCACTKIGQLLIKIKNKNKA